MRLDLSRHFSRQWSRVTSSNYLPERVRLEISVFMSHIRKPRVMFCTVHWLTGGMERKISNLLTQLVDFYDVYLFTVGEPNSKIVIPEKVETLILAESDYPAQYVSRATKEIQKHKIDAVVGVANLSNEMLDLYEQCISMGVKTIAANSEQYFYPYGNKNLYHAKQRQQEVYKQLDVVLWQTNFSAAAHSRVNDNGYVMPNPNTYQTQKQLAAKKNDIILAVGRFNDYIKRIDRILECFSIVAKELPSAELWLLGPLNRDEKIVRLGNRSINQMINQFDIDESKIYFIGNADSVENYYIQSSVLLLTSESEGFPNVVNEAASFGLPIICNAIPGLDDIVKHGYNGLVSEQNDITGLANNIHNVLTDHRLKEDLGNNASEYVKNFDIAKVVAKWKLVIDAVVTSKPELRAKMDKELRFKVHDSDKLKDDLLTTTEAALSNLSKDYVIIDGHLSESLESEHSLNRQLQAAVSRHDLLADDYNGIINSKSWRAVEKLRYIKSMGYRFKK